MNPFTNRGVITSEADFIGREEQLGEIIERLRTLQSSSVVGERRIGKSSLLYHLAQTGARRIEDGRYRFFYLDLLSRPADDYINRIEDRFRCIGKQVLLTFDEYEKMEEGMRTRRSALKESHTRLRGRVFAAKRLWNCVMIGIVSPSSFSGCGF